MQIKYILDDEGGIDPTDPLGDLVIEGDSGDTLLLKETFIDVWLLSFLKKILSIKNGEVSQIKVLEEPFCVAVKNDNDRLIFSYGGHTVSSSITDTVASFKFIGEKLIEELSQYTGFDKNLSLSELRVMISS